MVVPLRRITAAIDVSPVVEVPVAAKTVEVSVRTELRNDTEDDFVLHAPTAEDAIFWHVLDDKHREVLRDVGSRKPKQAARSGVEETVSLTLAGGHAEHETETLLLDAKKLKAGVTYTVRAEVFGQIAEAEFVVIRTMPLVPLVPAGEAGPKPKEKKAAAKGAKKPVPSKKPGGTGAGKGKKK